jgi:hypothetical protein
MDNGLFLTRHQRVPHGKCPPVGEDELAHRAPALAAASRACQPLIVTSSPALTKPGLSPLRIRPDGVPASNAHFSVLPFSVTSRKNQECGFSRRTSVNVPLTVMG